MTADSQALVPAEHTPIGRARPRSPGRDQQPGPRDAPVHHLRGDVLRRPVRGLLQRPGERARSGRRRRSSTRRSRSCRWSCRPTILLILSSFTCQFGVWAIRRDDRTAFLRSMAVTVVLGIIFLLMQATDYSILGSEGLTLSSGTFGTTYYTLTGFHGAHVFGGVIMLSVVLYRGHGRPVLVASTTTPSRAPRCTGTSSTSSGSCCSRCSTCCPARVGAIAMHPLRHPRNAALVGIVVPVRSPSSTGRCPTSAAGTSTTPGRRCSSSSASRWPHGLRARRRVQRGVIRRRSRRRRDLIRRSHARTDLERLPRPDHAARHPGLGRAHRALPVGIAGPRRGLAHLRSFRRLMTAPPARRGKQRVAPATPAGIHMPGPSFAPIFAAFGTVLLFLGLVFGGVDPVPRRRRPGPDPALLAAPRGCAIYDHDVEPTATALPAVVHDGPPPGVHMPGPSFRPILGAIGHGAPVPRPRVRRLAPRGGRRRPGRRPGRLAASTRAQGVRQDRRGRPDRPPREHPGAADAVAAVRPSSPSDRRRGGRSSRAS